jgi:hypothetical protein
MDPWQVGCRVGSVYGTSADLRGPSATGFRPGIYDSGPESIELNVPVRTLYDWRLAGT